jgi:ribosomal protein S18 acetylase RimI-like enzyme
MATDSKAAQSGIVVTRLTPGEVEELADDLHGELRDWTASSTQARSDHHFEELAMMVDNATFNTRLEVRVATFEGHRVGIAVTRASVSEGQPSTFIWWLAVDPAARRRGVGRALATAIEQDARERSHLLEGMVSADDPSAVAFWTTLGWHPAGPDRKDNWIRGQRTPTASVAAQQ